MSSQPPKNDPAVSQAPSTPSNPTPAVAVPEPVGPRDRCNEEPLPPCVVLEGVINPSPKTFDPANPAGAPVIKAVLADADRSAAHAELLRKDTSRFTPVQQAAHDKRTHELIYRANGETPPDR